MPVQPTSPGSTSAPIGDWETHLLPPPESRAHMRYFFNERNGDLKVDDEGLEFPSIREARVEAVRYAGEILRDHPTLVWTGDDFRIEVTDDRKLLLFTIIVVGVDAPAGRNLARHAAVLQAG